MPSTTSATAYGARADIGVEEVDLARRLAGGQGLEGRARGANRRHEVLCLVRRRPPGDADVDPLVVGPQGLDDESLDTRAASELLGPRGDGSGVRRAGDDGHLGGGERGVVPGELLEEDPLRRVLREQLGARGRELHRQGRQGQRHEHGHDTQDDEDRAALHPGGETGEHADVSGLLDCLAGQAFCADDAEGRHEGDRDDHRDEDDTDAGHADGAHDGSLEDEQATQGDRDREPGEEDGAAGRRHRPLGGVGDLLARGHPVLPVRRAPRGTGSP